jgi:hypothetical protein
MITSQAETRWADKPNTMNNKPTPTDALRILDSATHPANAGKLTRADYANVNLALMVLADFVDAHPPIPEEPKDSP